MTKAIPPSNKTSDKTKTPTDDLLADGKSLLQPSGNHARNYCRLSLRQKDTHLIVLLTNEIAKEAGFACHDDVAVFFDATTLTIVANSHKTTRVRKQEREGGSTYPYLLFRIGPDKPFNCTIDSKGSVRCEHHIDKVGRLVLSLPKTVHLTRKDTQLAA
jgi:hypothetical protein